MSLVSPLAMVKAYENALRILKYLEIQRFLCKSRNEIREIRLENAFKKSKNFFLNENDN